MNNSGLLSLDFIVGFTIFMIAFIAVATLVSGLLVGLQSKTIDYDAVAYRTGVILVEDPGSGIDSETLLPTTSWEFISNVNAHDDILRYGLAISKDYPNILTDRKVRQFFSNPSYTMDDYHSKAIFDVKPGSTDPPLYHFNIQLESFEAVPIYKLTLPSGERTPENVNVGYVHRVVKIKQPTEATIAAGWPIDASNRKPVATIPNDEFIVYFDFAALYGDPNPLYRIDPFSENVLMDIINLNTPNAPLNIPPGCPATNITRG